MKILFVCLGNICRSPIAEGITKRLANIYGLAHWEIASASTNTYHTGEPPHILSQKTCRNNDVDISNLRARRIKPDDMAYYDVIFVMAKDVMEEVKHLTSSAFDTSKVKLFMDVLCPNQQKDVPDPWYGDWEDFVKVYDIINNGCQKIIALYK
jgi:protein-tyrosine phosphatase